MSTEQLSPGDGTASSLPAAVEDLTAEAQALAARDPVAAARLRFQVAQILLCQSPPRVDEALNALQHAIDLDPAEPQHFEALESALLAEDRLEELAAAYRAAIEVCVVPLERARLLQRTADLWLRVRYPVLGGDPGPVTEELGEQTGRHGLNGATLAPGDDLDGTQGSESSRGGEDSSELQAVECLENILAIRVSELDLEIEGADLDALRIVRLRAARTLRELHGGAGRWQALAAVLGRQAEDQIGKERITTLVELGRVRADRLAAPEQAYEAMREAVTIDAQANEALEFCRGYLRTLGAWNDLAELLVEVAQACSPQGAAALWREVAEIAELQKKDDRLAVEAWHRAWELEPESAVPYRELCRLHRDADRQAELVAVLERAIRQAQDPAQKVELLRDLGRLLQSKPGREEAAASAFVRLVQLAPDDKQALLALAELHERAGRLDELAMLLRRLWHGSTPADRPVLGRRRVMVEAQRGAFHAELAALRDVSRGGGPEVRALLAERRVAHEARGHLQQAMPLVHLELGLPGLSADDAAALHLWLADAHEGHLVDPSRAVEALRNALALRPDDPAIAERLARYDPVVDRADETITRLQREAETAGEPRRASRLFYQVAQIQLSRQPPRLREAADVLQLALQADPRDEQTFALLSRLYLSEGRKDELKAAYVLVIAEAREEVRRVELLGRMARTLLDRQGDKEGAIECYEAQLKIDPINAGAFTALETLYRESERWADVARLYPHRLEHVSGDERQLLLLAQARLFAQDMGDDEQARRVYETVLTQDPNHAEAFEFVRGSHERASRWRELLEMLGQAAAALPVGQRVPRLRELAQVAEQKLASLDEAINALQQVVDLDAADLLSQRDLERLLAQTGRWTEYLQVLGQLVLKTLALDEKVALLWRMAQVARTELGDLARAAALLMQILQLAPDHPASLEALTEVLQRAGKRPELLALLKRRLQHAEATTERADLWRQIGVVSAELGKEEEALAARRMVHQLDPQDAATLGLLRAMLEKRSAWQELATLLTQQIGISTQRDLVISFNLELASLHEHRIVDLDSAARAYQAVLAVDATHPVAQDALARVLGRAGAWDRLIEALGHRAASERREGSALAQTFHEIGHIYEAKLNNVEAARSHYEKAAQADKDFLPALTALRLLALAREDWREAVALARREVNLVADPRQKAVLLTHVGDITRDRLSRPSRAMEAYDEALKAFAEHLPAVEALAQLSYDAGEHARAMPLYERVVNAKASGDGKHDLYFRLGMCAEQLARGDDAFAYYSKSFGYDPVYLPTLDRLSELCFARGQWENTQRVCEAILARHVDRKSVTELAELYYRVGMSELHLGQRRSAMGLLGGLVLERGMRPKGTENAWRDVADSWAQAPHEPRLLARMPPEMRTRAHGFLEQAIALSSRHPQALEALAASQLAAGAFEQALELMRKLGEVHIADPGRCADLALAAGDVQLIKLVDLEVAGRHYRQVMALSPGHPVAAARLETVKEQLARRAAAAQAAQAAHRAEEQALAAATVAPTEGRAAGPGSSPAQPAPTTGAGRETSPAVAPLSTGPSSVPPPAPGIIRPRTGEHRAPRPQVAVQALSPAPPGAPAPVGTNPGQVVPPPPPAGAPRPAGAGEDRANESVSIDVEVDDV